MRKLLIGVMAIGLVAALGAPAGAAKGPLKVATNLPAPGFWNGDTPATINGGYEYSLAGLIAKQLGYSGITILNVSFDALVAGKATGFDVAFSQVSITKDRAKVVGFSTPYYRSDNGIMVKSGTKVPNAAAARKLQWGVQTGTTQVEFLKNKLKVAKAPRVYQQTTDMFAALTAGQVDAVMTDTSIELGQAAQPGSNFKVVGQFKTDAGLYGAIFAKGSKLRAQVNTVIKKFQANGTLNKLNKKWLVPVFGGDPNKVPYLPL